MTTRCAGALGLGLRNDARLPTRVVALTALVELAQRRGDPEAADYVEELWTTATEMGEMQRSIPALSARGRQLLLDDDLAGALPVFWPSWVRRSAQHAGSHWPFAPDLAQVLGRRDRSLSSGDGSTGSTS